MMSMLSKDNKLIKLALKLKQKKYRDEENKFLIEGVRFVEEGIITGDVEHIFYSKKLFETRGHERILQKQISAYEVSDVLLKELCDTENPQGVAAIVNKRLWNTIDIKKDFILIADGVQDPGNMGTIIRTCDAAGVGAIAIIKGSVDIYNPKTLRSTMGSIFHIPVIPYEDFISLSEELSQAEFNIFAASLDTENYIYDCNFKEKTAVVIGNEANGIPAEHMKLCTHKVKIPIVGTAESLNAAVAGAVIIYEVVRQRMNTPWEGH
ncbi:MAG: methyltransferase [Clostridiales bacterium]|nr:methyltransferase [Clostridiales bacterium]